MQNNTRFDTYLYSEALTTGTCLNILLFWRRSTAALVFRVGACFEVSLFNPSFPTRPRP